MPKGLESEYLDCLTAELDNAIWRDQPDTLYLGGGTPSRLTVEQLERVLALIPGRPWAEATIEAAPGDLSEDLVRGWNEAGINRVSLGVQSFCSPELRSTGRKHTAETVQREVEMLRSAGISNINIDLIAGLPNQTAESWQTSLQWVRTLDPPHVSVYMLEVDEDSRLGREVLFNGKRYGAPNIPDDQTVAGFYAAALAHLRMMGVERYEISNFARSGRESLHNLKYWQLEPYTGFGADAHSFDGVTRFQNVEAAADYVRLMRAQGSARCEAIPAAAAEEKFFVGLRLAKGVQPAADEWRRWDRPIERFVREGLLERFEDRLRLTDQGVLFSNEVFAEFIDA